MPSLALGIGMKRRVTTGGKATKARRRKTQKPKRRTAPRVARRSQSSNADLQEQFDRRSRELNEALARETATANILKVISRSAFDLRTVLGTLANSAARLCGADRVVIRLEKDGSYHHLASFGLSPEQDEHMKTHPWQPDRGSIGGRVVIERKAIHIEDLRADTKHTPSSRGGFAYIRTYLGVPLMREDAPIGVLLLSRRVVQSFTDKQIEFVKNFAAQAVIAIENTRLLNELRQRTDDLSESLEQQTATSEVLKVISRSPGELEPVFQAMLANAIRLCEAKFGVMHRVPGWQVPCRWPSRRAAAHRRVTSAARKVE